MRSRHALSDRRKKPLDAARRDELALAYVARFATSRAKLARYLSRKIGESDWIDEADAMTSCEAGVAEMDRLGFVDECQDAPRSAERRVGYEWFRSFRSRWT